MSWSPTCVCSHGLTSHADLWDTYHPNNPDYGLWPDGQPITEGECMRCLCMKFEWDGVDGDKDISPYIAKKGIVKAR